MCVVVPHDPPATAFLPSHYVLSCWPLPCTALPCLQKRVLDVRSIRILVFDEADEMLKVGV